MTQKINRVFVILLLGLGLTACVGMKRVSDDKSGAGPSPPGQAVNSCTFAAHLKCIYLTGAETLSDGMDHGCSKPVMSYRKVHGAQTLGE